MSSTKTRLPAERGRARTAVRVRRVVVRRRAGRLRGAYSALGGGARDEGEDSEEVSSAGHLGDCVGLLGFTRPCIVSIYGRRMNGHALCASGRAAIMPVRSVLTGMMVPLTLCMGMVRLFWSKRYTATECMGTIPLFIELVNHRRCYPNSSASVRHGAA